MTLIEQPVQPWLKAPGCRELHNSINQDLRLSEFFHPETKKSRILTSNQIKLSTFPREQLRLSRRAVSIYTENQKEDSDLTTVYYFIWVKSSLPRWFNKYSHVFFSASTQLSIEAAEHKADVQQINTGRPCEQSCRSGGSDSGGHVHQVSQSLLLQTEELQQQFLPVCAHDCDRKGTFQDWLHDFCLALHPSIVMFCFTEHVGSVSRCSN